MRIIHVALCCLALSAFADGEIVFDTPASNDHGSMLLGNGMLGADVWVSPDGTLHAVFQRQDSWNEVGEHVKVGQIDYMTKRPVDGPYRQVMSVREGVCRFDWESGGGKVSLACRVQNEQPDAVFIVDLEGAPDAEAKTVSWRQYAGGGRDVDALDLQIQFEDPETIDPLTGERPRFTINADTLVPDGWYHENRRETSEKLFRLYNYWQGTDDLPWADPFTGRIFGALTRRRPEGGFLTAVTSMQGVDVDAWRAETERILDRGVPSLEAHLAAWNEFWKRSDIRIDGEEGALVSAAWRNQRYMTAIAGRGGDFPIRFNGSIFTTHEGADPDWRRWGHGYWWQNTRLAYYPMLMAGDGDLMDPLFDLYAKRTLPFFKARTRKYFGHGGAYFPECMVATGHHFFNCYGTRLKWEDRPDKNQDFGWHRREWVGQLELCWLMLDYRDYLGADRRFIGEFLPAIIEFIRFFDEHYAVGEDGRYIWEPAQALETWWEVRDPMPEIAGLTAVTDRLLALALLLRDGGKTRAFLERVRSRIPALPTMVREERQVFAPAARFDHLMNVELPELYCVFPFRLVTFAKGDTARAIATYETRTEKRYAGWNQDELFAATLGLAEEARVHLVERVKTNSNADFRWPAFWGPNYDWMPDQCAGGNIQNILQSMLMQVDGKTIHLLPAWPKEWNADFTLHAPFETVVTGRVEGGRLVRLAVTPVERRGDVVLPNGMTLDE